MIIGIQGLIYTYNERRNLYSDQVMKLINNRQLLLDTLDLLLFSITLLLHPRLQESLRTSLTDIESTFLIKASFKKLLIKALKVKYTHSAADCPRFVLLYFAMK